MNEAFKWILWKANAVGKRIGNRAFKIFMKADDNKNIANMGNGSAYMEPIKNYIYIDEKSPYVYNIHELFLYKMLGINKKYDDIGDINNINDKLKFIDDNSLIVDPNGRFFDANAPRTDWVQLYTDRNLPEKYHISFSAVVKTEFTEFQIAFRYRSITDRLRFMVVDNNRAVFEVVRHGIFFGTIHSTPFSFDLEKEYKIDIFINGNKYYFSVNGSVLLSVIDRSLRASLFRPKGGTALILWNNKADSDSNIKAQISNFNICCY